MKKRILALVMSVCMLISALPVTVLAADHVHDATCGYAEAAPCAHTHDGECGYIEAVEGAACTHSCADGSCAYQAAIEGAACTHEHYGCGYEAAVPATPCTHVCSEETGCTDGCAHDLIYHDGDCGYFEGSPESPCEHEHDGTCGYVAAVAGVPCDHAHDSSCGYVEAVTGAACTHTCTDGGSCGYSEGSECTYVEPTYYTITYTDGVAGEVIFPDQSYTIAAGESIVYFSGSLEREGYVFNGWTPELERTVTKDMTYTAVWNVFVETGHTITYTDGVAGEVIFEDQVYTDVASGDATPAFEGTPTRTGFNFKGWSPTVAATVTGDATYTARWEEIHTHSYSAATCAAPATCSCGATTGGVDKSNHVGGTEVRNAKAATEFEDGYTGDTYCKGCGDKLSEGQTIPATHDHSYSAATCAAPATCSCGATTGDVDKSNHVGGTEVRNAKAATEFEDGYTGDTYCKGCGDKLQSGSAIPATHTHSYNSYDYDRNGHWKVCSCGATQAVEDHDWYIYKKDANKHYWRCDCGNNGWGNDHFDNNATGKCDDCGYDLHTHSYTQEHDHTNHWNVCSCGDKKDEEKHKITYTFLDNLVHRIDCEGCDFRNDDAHMGGTNHNYNDGGHWIDCSSCEGRAHYGIHTYDDKYDRYCNGIILYNSKGEHIGTDPCKYDKHAFCESDGDPFGQYSTTDTAHERTCKDCGLTVRENHTANTYHSDAAAHTEVCVCGKSLGEAAHNGTKYDVPATMDYLGIERYVLYVDGVQAGLYFPSGNEADFVEGYDPETLKAQQDDNDLGSVTIPADYNNAAIADLAPGKTYKVSVIGSNDISVEGLTEVNGTVTQTFKIPDALVGAKNVKYVAVHDTNPYAAELAAAEQAVKNDPYDETIQLIYENVKSCYDDWEKEHGSSAEFGTVTISLDGLTLTATHTAVKGFSPFIVYAFVEADEPVYKTFVTQEDGTLALVTDDQPVTHTVAQGENLTDIARQYGCTVEEIVALNSDLIENPSKIYVGWELVIPGK